MADSVLQNYPAAQWKWHYEHGLVVKAIAEVVAITGDARFLDFDKNWVDHFVTGSGEIRTYRTDEYNLDQICPGRLLFRLYGLTGAKRYAQALQLLRAQLSGQPRNSQGGFWHKLIYPNQMWLDGLYMSGPFAAEYAHTFHEPALFDDIAHQFLLIEENARDPRSGLLYHAWDAGKEQRWAHPETGCSPHFWGRAMGWFAMALVDVLDFFPVHHPEREALIGALNRLAQALVRFQDPVTGLWYQIVDSALRPGNYQESSVSAMLVYAFAKGVRQGYLGMEFLVSAQRAYRGLLENKVRMDARGSLTLEGTCSVAGLGGSPYRDGSFQYYVSEPVASNDFKGVGPFILAALAMEDAGLERIP